MGRQKASSVEYSTIPEPGSILLEQWTVSMSYENDGGDDGNNSFYNSLPAPAVSPPYQISSRSLLQAVRSYLHFSQLSAWYSKSGGAQPKNVLFRITIPDEAFSRFVIIVNEYPFLINYFDQVIHGNVTLDEFMSSLMSANESYQSQLSVEK